MLSIGPVVPAVGRRSSIKYSPSYRPSTTAHQMTQKQWQRDNEVAFSAGNESDSVLHLLKRYIIKNQRILLN